MTSFKVKQGDTARILNAQLMLGYGANAQPMPFSTVNQVNLVIQAEDGTITTRTATVVDSSLAKVMYQLQTADVDEVGSFNLEWVAVQNDGTSMHFPTDEYIVMEVVASLTGS